MKNSKDISLLSKWRNKNKEDRQDIEIKKAPQESQIPLSNGQKRLWFLQQLHPGNPFYNYSEIHTFKGELDVQSLLKSIQHIYDQHNILRSTYHIENGIPIQVITPISKLKIDIFDISVLDDNEASVELKNLLDEQASTNFDLLKGPLFKVTLIKQKENQHLLHISLHHIISDEWSMEIFRNQLAKNYAKLNAGENLQLEELPIQYTDFAYHQQQLNTSEKQLDYWKSKLSGVLPVLNIPTDYTRPVTPSFKGDLNSFELPKQLSEDAIALSQKLKVTPYVLFLSAYYVLLSRYCNQEDIAIGSPITNRNHKALEKLIGFFNDTVVLRTRLSDKISFENLVKEVRKTTLEAFANKDVSFDLLVKTLQPERSLSANPFFQVMFLYNTETPIPSFSSTLDFKYQTYGANASKFDLTLFVSENEKTITTTFEYATELFKEATIKNLQEYLKNILEEVIYNPQKKIADISLVKQQKEADHQLIQDEINLESILKNNTGIHHLIEKIASENPDKIALSFKEQQMTYGELNKKATDIAMAILDSINGPKNIIGLCMERSLEMIVGMLGILKSGHAYLPIDPDYPSDRIAYILSDAGVNTIVTQKRLNSKLDVLNLALVNIDRLEVSQSTAKLPKSDPENLAYVIYTSGSTGKPKGVPITHRNILFSTLSRLHYYRTSPTAFLLMSSIAFDSSKAGIFWTLCTGGTLVISEKRIEQDIEQISDYLENHKISHTLMLPSLYKLILEHADKNKLKNLKSVIVAGEACSIDLCKIHYNTLANVKLFNEYGPTEATVWSTVHEIQKDDLNSPNIPIGKPIPGAKAFILDKNLQQTPKGAIGELYIGGPGLSGNYINRQDLTDKLYIKNPFDKEEILYKTGDLVRIDVNDNLIFLGRTDQQVKIRGHRIELNEIENIISGNSMVANVAVVIEKRQKKGALLNYDDAIDSENLSSLLLEHLDENQIIELLTSVTTLNDEEKKYMLENYQN